MSRKTKRVSEEVNERITTTMDTILEESDNFDDDYFINPFINYEVYESLSESYKDILSKKSSKKYTNISMSMMKDCVKQYYDKQHERIKLQNRFRSIVSMVELYQKNMFDLDNGMKTIKEVFGKKFPIIAESYIEGYISDLAHGHGDLMEHPDIQLLKLRIELELAIELGLKNVIENRVKQHPLGQYLLTIMGLGPVLVGGVLSYINIEECQTAGAIWKYAGITGSVISDDVDELADSIKAERRTRDKKCDWNPNFRNLAWKIGESFMKQCNRPGKNNIYGRLYKDKLNYYIQKNEDGGFAVKAAAELKLKKFKEDTDAFKAYSSGKLPKAHLIAMAKRYAVKIFFAHYFEIAYRWEYNQEPPKPYPLAHLNHAHYIIPYNAYSIKPKDEIVGPKKRTTKSKAKL